MTSVLIGQMPCFFSHYFIFSEVDSQIVAKEALHIVSGITVEGTKEGSPSPFANLDANIVLSGGVRTYAYQQKNGKHYTLTIPKEAVKFEYDAFGFLKAMYDKEGKKLTTTIPQTGYVHAVTDEQAQEFIAKHAVVTKETSAPLIDLPKETVTFKVGNVVQLGPKEKDGAQEATILFMDSLPHAFLPKTAFDKSLDALRKSNFDYVRLATVYDTKDGTAIDALYNIEVQLTGTVEDGWAPIQYIGKTAWIKAADLEVHK